MAVNETFRYQHGQVTPVTEDGITINTSRIKFGKSGKIVVKETICNGTYQKVITSWTPRGGKETIYREVKKIPNPPPAATLARNL